MRVFITGASGYIGGSVAAALMEAGHHVGGLARSDETTEALAKLGIKPVRGTLDDAEVLAKAARDADITVNAANAGHRAAAEAMLKALANTGKAFLHTGGSSIVGTRARGELVEKVFDEDTSFTPTPQRAPRVEIDRMVRSAAGNGVRAIVIAPSLIYGLGHGRKRRKYHARGVRIDQPHARARWAHTKHERRGGRNRMGRRTG